MYHILRKKSIVFVKNIKKEKIYVKFLKSGIKRRKFDDKNIKSMIYNTENGLLYSKRPKKEIKRNVSVATGASAYDFICDMVGRVTKLCVNINCNVYKIENDFFGHSITVAGLITGVDLIKQLSGKDLGQELLISRTTLRSEGDLFLCNTSLKDVEKSLGVKLTTVEQDGAAFVECLLGIGG